jgi:hypothetical protein
MWSKMRRQVEQNGRDIKPYYVDVRDFGVGANSGWLTGYSNTTVSTSGCHYDFSDELFSEMGTHEAEISKLTRQGAPDAANDGWVKVSRG